MRCATKLLGCWTHLGLCVSLAGACHVGDGTEARDTVPVMTDASAVPDAWALAPAPDAELPRDAEPPTALPLTVSTLTGVLRGKLSGSTREFLAIPYAEPPLGALRFAAPLASEPWQGARDASAFGPSCPQYADPISDAIRPDTNRQEDCLTLNVFAPVDGRATELPVMVFFHGGGFTTGGSSFYDAQALSEAGPVVVVTVNYRLGPLGFLTLPALDQALGIRSGNMGLRDQQLALRWVRDNIASFGGDSQHVTLFGQSAGAVATCLHMVMPESAGLAAGFIVESGACVAGETAPWTRERIETLSSTLVADLCAGQTDVVACLRGLPTDALTGWLPADPVRELVLSLVEISTTAGQDYWPYVDGVLIPEPPLAAIRKGAFAKKPLIVGSTSNEWALQQSFGFPRANNKVDLEFWSGLMLGQYDLARLRTRYTPDTDAEANASWTRLWSDSWFRCASRTLARETAAQGVNAYLYEFAVAPGAHAQELDYVFGWPGGRVSTLFPGVAPVPPLPDLVKAMQALWTSYARTGVPEADGVPAWPAYTREADENLQLAPTSSVQQGLSEADCDLWDELRAID